MTFNQSALDFKKMITTIATWDLTIFIMQSQIQSLLAIIDNFGKIMYYIDFKVAR